MNVVSCTQHNHECPPKDLVCLHEEKLAQTLNWQTTHLLEQWTRAMQVFSDNYPRQNCPPEFVSKK